MKRKGFTLIEVVVSLALLGMISVGAFSLFSTTMKINKTNKEKQQIHEEIVTEMENYRSKTYKEIIMGNQLEKTVDKGSYEICTKIEFELDPQISINQSYGYLQMHIYAQNKETKEMIDEIKTYVSNNGDDTTILVRVRDEWSKLSENIYWIQNIQTELSTEYNSIKDTKTTDILGKTIYFDPPVGEYKVDLLTTVYEESPLSPNKEKIKFAAKKGCTTYQEYWVYKPIDITVTYTRGTDNMDVSLKTNEDETILIDETFEEYNEETAYTIRPLGQGNQSYYKIKAGFGTETESELVWVEDKYLYDEWTHHWGQYKLWTDNYIDHIKDNGATNHWKTATSETLINGMTRYTHGGFYQEYVQVWKWKGKWERVWKWVWKYKIWYSEQYADGTRSEAKWIKGEWVPNPDSGSSYDHVYRYLINSKHQEIQEGVYTPNYDANLYYKNTDNQWILLDPKKLKLQKTEENKFEFEYAIKNSVTHKYEMKLIVKALTDTTPVNEATDNMITLTITQ